MPRVDFYRLTRDPAARVVAALAERVLAQGERLLVVVADDALRTAVSDALWAHKPESFLAHGSADGELAQHDPILLARDMTSPANGAAMLLLADGEWREGALEFARTLYLFDNSRIDDARAVWRALGGRDGVERRFWQQDTRGKWTEGP